MHQGGGMGIGNQRGTAPGSYPRENINREGHVDRGHSDYDSDRSRLGESSLSRSGLDQGGYRQDPYEQTDRNQDNYRRQESLLGKQWRKSV